MFYFSLIKPWLRKILKFIFFKIHLLDLSREKTWISFVEYECDFLYQDSVTSDGNTVLFLYRSNCKQKVQKQKQWTCLFDKQVNTNIPIMEPI